MHTRKFCFVCGKRTDKLTEGRCENCIQNVFVKLPEKIEIKACSKCNKMLLKNKWTDFNLERILESAAKVSGKLKKIELYLDKKKIKATFFLIPTFSDKEKKEIHETDFHIIKIICPSCSRKYSGYYEAVLQLRGFSESDLAMMEDIFSMMEKKTFYNIKDIKGGFDIKIGKKAVVNTAAKSIRSRFPNLETKESMKIVTKIDGRDVHRKFILIRKLQKD